MLGATVYGQLGIIRSTVNMFTAFAGAGLGLTATKYVAENKNSSVQKSLRIVALSEAVAFIAGLFLSLAIILFAKEIAIQINAPSLKTEIRIGAFMLFFASLNGVQNGILAGFENFKSIAKNTLFAGIVSFIIQIIATWIWGLKGAIIGLGINFLVLWFLNKNSIAKIIPQGLRIKKWDKSMITEISILWKFSFPAIMSGIMVEPVTWICNTMLVNHPNGYKQMALFDIANQWRMTVLFIPTALSRIILPMLSSSLQDKSNFRLIFLKNLKLNAIISTALLILIIALSPVIQHFYGREFSGIAVPLILMTLSTLLIAVNNVVGQVIASKGRMWLGFSLNIIWAICLLSVTYYLIDFENLGVIGLCFAYLISYAVHSVLQFLFVKKYLF